MKQLMFIVVCVTFVVIGNSKSWASIAFSSVQTCDQSSTSTLTCTASMTMASGDTIILYTSEHGSGFSYTVSDTCSQSWTHQPLASFTEGTAIQIDAWTVTNATAGTCSITVTRSATAAVRFQWLAANYTGAAQLGGMTSGGNTASSTCSVSLTTQDDNNVVVAGFANFAAETYTASAGTLRGQTSNIAAAGALSDNTAATPSSVTNTVSLSTSAACAKGAIELRSGARTDRNLTSAIIPPNWVCPPSVGAGSCTPGTNGQNLPNTGWLSTSGTTATDSNYNGVKIVRLTDSSDSTTCNGGPGIGPGGSAEEHIISEGDDLFVISCSSGRVLIKVFDPSTLQVGNYVTNAGSTWHLPSGAVEFSYITDGYLHLLNNTQVQLYTINVSFPNGSVASGPTTEADFSYAIPCWQNTCADWAHGTFAAGTNLLPLTNNSANHVFQLMNIGTFPCSAGSVYPNFSSSSTSELTMITDGGCTWLDIGPMNTITHTYPGLVSTDDSKWSAGLANFQGDGGNGSMFVVTYNSLTQAYYHLNVATGNAYSAACSGGSGYNCASGSFTRTFIGNIIPSGQDLVLLHNLKIGKDATYVTVGPQKCAFPSSLSLCPVAGGGDVYFWKVGTTTEFWPQIAPGHHASGYGTLASEQGYTGTFPKVYSFGTPFSGATVNQYWDLNSGAACSPNACPSSPPFDYHVSWTTANATDTMPVCGATLANSYGNWPFQYPFQGEIVCFATDGSNTVWRQAMGYNTYSNPIFDSWAAIGALSQDGKFFAVTSDWWNTLGNTDGVSSSCNGGFQWVPGFTYNLNDKIAPGTNNGPVNGGRVFQATSCMSGVCKTETLPSHPNWCTTGTGCTTPDNNVTWTDVGANTCREDVFVFKLQ